MRANKDLIKFIKEARKRGFDDYKIKEALRKNNWNEVEIEKAFYSLRGKEHYKFKNKIDLFLDNEVLKGIEKRARKNMFTISEQVEDILRRSVVSGKRKMPKAEKLDDVLVGIFSRRKRKK